jgi:hypothetical protein
MRAAGAAAGASAALPKRAAQRCSKSRCTARTDAARVCCHGSQRQHANNTHIDVEYERAADRCHHVATSAAGDACPRATHVHTAPTAAHTAAHALQHLASRSDPQYKRVRDARADAPAAAAFLTAINPAAQCSKSRCRARTDAAGSPCRGSQRQHTHNTHIDVEYERAAGTDHCTATSAAGDKATGGTPSQTRPPRRRPLRARCSTSQLTHAIYTAVRKQRAQPRARL